METFHLISDFGNVRLPKSTRFMTKRNIEQAFPIKTHNSIETRAIEEEKVKRIEFCIETFANFKIMLVAFFFQKCAFGY